MAGPTTPEEALKWIQEAMRAGRFIPPGQHFGQRLAERRFDMSDVFRAVENATSIKPYEKGNLVHGGTGWRVFGPDVDGERRVAVGVEAFGEKQRRRVCLCTVFNPDEESEEQET